MKSTCLRIPCNVLLISLYLAACTHSTNNAVDPTAVNTAQPTAVNTAQPSIASANESVVAKPAPAQTGFAFEPRDAVGGKGWYPIHAGVTVAPIEDGTAMAVTYHRERGKAAGVAFELTPGACIGLSKIHMRLSSSAKQRLMVCITDSRGIVWSLGSIQVSKEMTDFTLSAAEARPDSFQNAGKEAPTTPDWSDMRMLTILDISGYIGGAAVDCAWRIEALRGVGEAR